MSTETLDALAAKVAKATETAFRAEFSMTGDNGDDLLALCAAVRAHERARCRKAVEGVQGFKVNVDGRSMISDVNERWLDRPDVLAALNAPETP